MCNKLFKKKYNYKKNNIFKMYLNNNTINTLPPYVLYIKYEYKCLVYKSLTAKRGKVNFDFSIILH